MQVQEQAVAETLERLAATLYGVGDCVRQQASALQALGEHIEALRLQVETLRQATVSPLVN